MCSESIFRAGNTAPFVIFAVVILLNALTSGKCSLLIEEEAKIEENLIFVVFVVLAL